MAGLSEELRGSLPGAPQIRARICEQLAWLGLELDREANAASAARIAALGSTVSAWVIPTDEEHTLAITLEAGEAPVEPPVVRLLHRRRGRHLQPAHQDVA